MNSIDSQKYLSEIIRNHHPEFDYDRIDDLTLGEAWFFSDLVASQLLYMILYRSDRLPIEFPDWRAIRRELKSASLLQAATRLCELCPDRQLIAALVDAVLENGIITRELRDRLADKPIGRDLVLV